MERRPNRAAKGAADTHTGGKGVAARSISTLHSILAHAKRLDIISTNPAIGVRKLAGKAKQRRLSVGEIQALGKAIMSAPATGEHPVGLAAVHFLLLTGFRISEAVGLHRDWINADRNFIRFPDTKTDGQIRPIGKAAIELALAQPVRSKSPYIFPSDARNRTFYGNPLRP